MVLFFNRVFLFFCPSDGERANFYLGFLLEYLHALPPAHVELSDSKLPDERRMQLNRELAASVRVQRPPHADILPDGWDA